MARRRTAPSSSRPVTARDTSHSAWSRLTRVAIVWKSSKLVITGTSSTAAGSGRNCVRSVLAGRDTANSGTNPTRTNPTTARTGAVITRGTARAAAMPSQPAGTPTAKTTIVAVGKYPDVGTTHAAAITKTRMYAVTAVTARALAVGTTRCHRGRTVLANNSLTR
ncbi:hypothetical protein [Micromonospora sp. NPDC005220]|uniref:hypothetical protein n=1 Tax=Micromonospora sp. NPDC005220 TaxID=3155589 RepID=UPI0033BD18F3